MDLLDRIREEAGDAAQADRLGLRELERRKAAPMLLAGMLPSREGAKAEEHELLTDHP
jgi:hypothetical protein